MQRNGFEASSGASNRGTENTHDCVKIGGTYELGFTDTEKPLWMLAGTRVCGVVFFIIMFKTSAQKKTLGDSTPNVDCYST